MAIIDVKKNVIKGKIVYYGPGLCGKTTNLEFINRAMKGSQEMMSLATEGDRTIFFDFLPMDLGEIRGISTKFKLYTVPGQVRYNLTRKMVLKNADGVVFVADSQRAMMDENIDSLANLFDNMRELKLDPKKISIVLQYNKRDLPNLLTKEELDKTLNNNNYPTYMASALSGEGVIDTLKGISRAVFESISETFGPSTSTKKKKPAAEPPPPPKAKKPASKRETHTTKNGTPVKERERTQQFILPKGQPGEVGGTAKRGAPGKSPTAGKQKEKPIGVTPVSVDKPKQATVKASKKKSEKPRRSRSGTKPFATREETTEAAPVDPKALERIIELVSEQNEKLDKRIAAAFKDSNQKLEGLVTDVNRGLREQKEDGEKKFQKLGKEIGDLRKELKGLDGKFLNAVGKAAETTPQNLPDIGGLTAGIQKVLRESIAGVAQKRDIEKISRVVERNAEERKLIAQIVKRLDGLDKNLVTILTRSEQKASEYQKMIISTVSDMRKELKGIDRPAKTAERLQAASGAKKTKEAAKEDSPRLSHGLETAKEEPQAPQRGAIADTKIDEKKEEEKGVTKAKESTPSTEVPPPPIDDNEVEEVRVSSTPPSVAETGVDKASETTEKPEGQADPADTDKSDAEGAEESKSSPDVAAEERTSPGETSSTDQKEQKETKPEESSKPEEDKTISDPAHKNAARVARVMVSDLELYHSKEVNEGIENDDIEERLKKHFEDMRATYESRIPEEIRQHKDYLKEAIDKYLDGKKEKLNKGSQSQENAEKDAAPEPAESDSDDKSGAPASAEPETPANAEGAEPDKPASESDTTQSESDSKPPVVEDSKAEEAAETAQSDEAKPESTAPETAESNIPTAPEEEASNEAEADSKQPPTEDATSSAVKEEAQSEQAKPKEKPPEEEGEASAESPPAEEKDFSNNPQHKNAARIARVMVSDLGLYHREDIAEGIKNGDIHERFKGQFDDMRATYEARVPEEVRREKDYLAEAIDKFIKKQTGMADGN